MAMQDERNTVSHFSVLFTAQKLKKRKTWQDGFVKYYNFNRKMVLIDEKGYHIDKAFSKTGLPSVGDEIDFDMHIVTVESMDHQEPYVNVSGQHLMSAQQPHRSLPMQDQQYRTAEHHLPAISPTTPNVSTMTAIANSPSFQSIHLGQPDLATLGTAPPFTRRRGARLGIRRPVQASLPPVSSAVQFVYTPTTPTYTSDTSNPVITAPPPPSSVHPQPVVSPPYVVVPYSKETAQQQIPSFNSSASISHDAGSLPIVPTSPSSSHTPAVPVQPLSSSASEKPPVPGSQLQAMPGSSDQQQALNHAAQQSQRISVLARTHPALQSTALASSQSQSPFPSFQRPLPTPAPGAPQQSPVPTIQPDIHPEPTKRLEDDTQTAPTKRARAGRVGLSKPSLQVSGSPTPAIAGSSTRNSLISSGFMPASRIEALQQGSDNPSGRAPKRFKAPMSDGALLPLQFKFPTADNAMEIKNSHRFPKRSKTAPNQFTNANQYKEAFRRMLHEHIQQKVTQSNDSYDPKALAFIYTRSMGDCQFLIKVKAKESHSKYSKDDIWVVSKSLLLDPASSFLARSTYYGPSADNTIHASLRPFVTCLTPRDARVASKFETDPGPLFALRTISAGAEFMMLDALEEGLDRLPILHSLLKHPSKRQKDLHPPATLATLTLDDDDCIDINEKLQETIQQYHLNEDQASCLRALAKSVIISPRWNDERMNPITLVHGVFGSGKSYLAAVMVIFLRDVIDTANTHRTEERQISFKIMISCFTNVAVDRILSTLVRLGYDNFIRVGSLKRIAKNLLPYTVKSKLSGNEELKELESMLDDPQNSEEDTNFIANAVQRFRRCENMLEVRRAEVVGTTCSASNFEIFSESKFQLVLMDECSQLSPTIPTPADETATGQGLDKTLYSRLVEIGYSSILLRTQYRCHPRISDISNELFYFGRLNNGSIVSQRKALVEGLPPLLFVDVLGNEQRSSGGNSFWNHDEVSVIVHTLEGLLQLGVDAEQIGVIALYKEQADKIQFYLGNNTQTGIRNVQISTVDAFQGAEKEIILLSTVRTSSAGFIDNHSRVNVSLTRAKRHLLIFGSRHLLLGNQVWAKVIAHCGADTLAMNELAQQLSSLKMAHLPNL
ncbi:hypothetical protein DM01DRAFT_1374888 [Hesseltinella vesiculosa]|uniref:DUF2439 domain-containing protein n=1 Tax=Hesseltinella vesiculosa TaxID=101127 RepID=A0A1X2GH08_9FUNG|nr:hypothetical protein DM01DRAFT_1374888 [Hesseltinella vesiculosa]